LLGREPFIICCCLLRSCSMEGPALVRMPSMPAIRFVSSITRTLVKFQKEWARAEGQRIERRR
jgi:hypothetical protein